MDNHTVKRRVLIVGGNGFFGRTVNRVLGETSLFSVRSCSRRELDVTDRDNIRRIFKEFKPQSVINCSGITGNANCSKDPELAQAVNVIGVQNLVNACRESACLLIHPSSVVVFDGFKGNYREDDHPNPPEGNIYAETKAEAENVVCNSGVEYIMPRISTGYGPIHKGDTTNFIGIVTTVLQREGQGHFFYDQYSNPVEIEDTVNALIFLIKSGFRGCIHLGGPEIISMHQFAGIIKEEFGLKGEIIGSSLKGSNYPQMMTLNISQAQNLEITFKKVKEGVKTSYHQTKMRTN